MKGNGLRLIIRLALAQIVIATCLMAGAVGQETKRYRLHFTGVSCVVRPCPQWQATDVRSGERFDAVVDFSAVGGQPRISAFDDILTNAYKMLAGSSNGLVYNELVIVSIVY